MTLIQRLSEEGPPQGDTTFVNASCGCWGIRGEKLVLCDRHHGQYEQGYIDVSVAQLFVEGIKE